MCRKVTPRERAIRAGWMDMILAAIGLAAAGVDVNDLNSRNRGSDTDPDQQTATTSSLVLIYISIALSILRFVMGLVLLKGARKRNERMVRAWLCSSIILWIIQFIQFVTKLAIGTFVLWSTISSSLAVTIRLVVMYIVYKFINEINQERLPLLSE